MNAYLIHQYFREFAAFTQAIDYNTFTHTQFIVYIDVTVINFNIKLNNVSSIRT